MATNRPEPWEPDLPELVEPSTWAAVDLGLIDATPKTAELLSRTDGVNLAYTGKMNWIYGVPESGKTWIALLAAVQALNAGHRVLWLDYEDSPETFVERMVALGTKRAVINDPARLAYVAPIDRLYDTRPGGGLDETKWSRHLGIRETHLAWTPHLVVVDSCAGGMALEALSITSNDDVPQWIRLYLRPFTNAGAGVIVIDHLPKGAEADKRFPIGAQHKLASLDGVALRCTTTKSWGRHPGGTTTEPVEGTVKLQVSKDRAGAVRAHITGDEAGTFHVEVWPNGDIVATITAPDDANTDNHKRTTIITSAMVAVLKDSPPLQLAGLLALVAEEPGIVDSAAAIKAAIQIAQAHGHIDYDAGTKCYSLRNYDAEF